jgi:putative ABC transport system substrate-binding protein
VLLVAYSVEDKYAQEFRQGLTDAGYSEGRDVLIEWRSANGNFAQIPSLVTELIEGKPELIVVESTAAAQGVKRATSTIPIVMAVVADPVGSGLVASLAHPSGNITGLSVMTPELSVKRLQLLKDAIPRLVRVAVLWNPDTSFHTKVVQDLKSAAPSLSIELLFLAARTPAEIDLAFLPTNLAHAQALLVIEDPVFDTQRMTLAKLAAKAHLPAIYGGDDSLTLAD